MSRRQAGEFDRRITIQRRVETQATGGFGDTAVEWVELQRPWARRRVLRGTERFVSQQFEAQVSVVFELRHPVSWSGRGNEDWGSAADAATNNEDWGSAGEGVGLSEDWNDSTTTPSQLKHLYRVVDGSTLYDVTGILEAERTGGGQEVHCFEHAD